MRIGVLGACFLSLSCGFTAPPQATRSVAITIDDLPGVSAGPEADALDRMTTSILAALSRHNVTVTGFVNENKLYRSGMLQHEQVALLRRWLENGQKLGNHTYSHRRLFDTPTAEFVQDILDGERVTRPLVEATGGRLRYFRHPYLNTGRSLEQRNAVNEFLTEHGYVVAPVTIDNYDYEFATAYARGYVFITLDEALTDTAYQRPDTVVTRFGFSWLHRWAITADMDRAIFRGEPEVPTWVTEP